MRHPGFHHQSLMKKGEKGKIMLLWCGRGNLEGSRCMDHGIPAEAGCIHGFLSWQGLSVDTKTIETSTIWEPSELT